MLKVFFTFFADKNIDCITEKDIVYFNTNYILAKDYSVTFQNQIINAIKLFYRNRNNRFLNLDRFNSSVYFYNTLIIRLLYKANDKY